MNTATDDLTVVALDHVGAARALFDSGFFSAAFYLAGCAVECGLKAVLTRDLTAYVLPQKDAVKDAYTHNLPDLARQCGVDPLADATVRVHWNTLKDAQWSPDARYRVRSAVETREVVEAAEVIVEWLKPLW